MFNECGGHYDDDPLCNMPVCPGQDFSQEELLQSGKHLKTNDRLYVEFIYDISERRGKNVWIAAIFLTQWF